MKKILLLGIVFFLSTISIFAFKLSPIVADFESEGKAATKTFALDNPGERPVAVKVSVYTRSIDIDGTEIRELADKDFIVYPSQLIIKPKSKKSVRVKWIGKKTVESELAYRIIAEQLPVNLNKEKKQGTNLNIMLKYIGSLYVLPSSGVGDHNIVVESFQKAKDETTLDSYAHLGERGLDVLEIVLNNTGKKHCVIKNYNFKVKTVGGPILYYSEKNFPYLISQNILSGLKRRVLIPWTKDFKGDFEYVQFTYDSM